MPGHGDCPFGRVGTAVTSGSARPIGGSCNGVGSVSSRVVVVVAGPGIAVEPAVVVGVVPVVVGVVAVVVDVVDGVSLWLLCATTIAAASVKTTHMADIWVLMTPRAASA